MEQKKVNIAALLQGCPKGTRLYSPVCGECELYGLGIEKIKIYAERTNGLPLVFDKHGYLTTEEDVEGNRYANPNGECLLFPSKEVRDWGCFRVKYIVLTDDRERNRKLINLFGKVNNESGKGVLSIKGIDASKIVYLDRLDNCLYDRDNSVKNSEFYDGEYDYILSTGTELKLKEEQPKFKVGDVVKADSDISGNVIGAVESTEHCGYKNDRFKLWVVDGGKAGSIDIPIKDTSRLATPEEITKWNKEVLEPNHLHYSKSKRKIIHWFLPFDRVVVRHFGSAYWHYNLFSDWDTDNVEEHYICIDAEYKYCLPYNDKTAKLIGTTDDYKDEE